MRDATCADCGEAFVVHSTRGALPQRCSTCRDARKHDVGRQRSARWRAANPERNKEQQNRFNRKRLANPDHLRWKREDAMRRAYGMEPADFDRLLTEQGGKCAICGGGPNGPGKRLHVDHCHNSKRVRGLLCAKCNTAVGLLDDDPQRADRLATYLRQ